MRFNRGVILLLLPVGKLKNFPFDNPKVCQSVLNSLPFSVVITTLRDGLLPFENSESKENVRSALNRAIHKGGRNVATASDADFLYVWNETE